MTRRPGTAGLLATVLVALSLAACSAPPGDEAAAPATDDTTTAPEQAASPSEGPPNSPTRTALTDPEQRYLEDLTRRGIEVGTSPVTAVEVGVGICRSLASGVDPESVPEQIAPLTTALAARSADDPAAVGRALVDASRAHLCD